MKFSPRRAAVAMDSLSPSSHLYLVLSLPSICRADVLWAFKVSMAKGDTRQYALASLSRGVLLFNKARNKRDPTEESPPLFPRVSSTTASAEPSARTSLSRLSNLMNARSEEHTSE